MAWRPERQVGVSAVTDMPPPQEAARQGVRGCDRGGQSQLWVAKTPLSGLGWGGAGPRGREGEAMPGATGMDENTVEAELGKGRIWRRCRRCGERGARLLQKAERAGKDGGGRERGGPRTQHP